MEATQITNPAAAEALKAIKPESISSNAAPFALLRAGHMPAAPKWQNDSDCDQGGWYSDIHGTLMAPVTTDWNQFKPYTYLCTFLPDDSSDPQYGFVYAGKAEQHADKGRSIVDHDYSGSPGKSNVWRAIVNRAQPHEIVKYVVGVYDTVEECREAERRLIEHLWDRFGRVDKGGIVTNLVLDPFDTDRSLTPEESRALSERRKGRPNGRGQPIFIRELDGTEHNVGCLTEAVDLVVKLAGLERSRALNLVRDSAKHNKSSLKVNPASGLLICYEIHKNNPVRKTAGDRLVRVRDTIDGTAEVITADQFMDRFEVSRKQLGSAINNSEKGWRFRSQFLVAWADGDKQKRETHILFDRVTGKQLDSKNLIASGFNAGQIYLCAKRNQSVPYVAYSVKPKGRTQEFYKTYLVYEDDLDKPMTPTLLDRPVALLPEGSLDGVEVFNSTMQASKSLGLADAAVNVNAKLNSSHLAKGVLPKRWALNAGTHVAIYLHELPAYCQLTDQTMPFSLMPYVADIAKWRAQNPRANRKAARKPKQLKAA